MHRLIASKRDAIAALCRRFGVARLEIIGSAARGSDFNEQSSDADFLVEFHTARRISPLEEYFGLRDELSSLLDRPVDLVETRAIRNPYVLRSINQARELVYAA